jgi:hypothetical protein
MTRLLSCLLAVGVTAGCVQTPRNTHEECRLEAGWLDSTAGCAEHEGYPDCWKVCADGSRERVGARPSPAPPPAAQAAASR